MGSAFRRSAAPWVLGFVLAALPLAAFAAQRDQRLVTAAAEQDTAKVRELLKARVDVNAPRADGATALLYAAHWNDLETTGLLLRAGANVNAADDYGVTPLARACENASVPMVETLLKAGADVNAAQKSGLTPLMIAAATGNVQVIKLLIAHGANLNAITIETKNTALMWAVSNQHPDGVRILVEAKADVHAATEKGFTVLMFAARNGDVEMAKFCSTPARASTRADLKACTSCPTRSSQGIPGSPIS